MNNTIRAYDVHGKPITLNAGDVTGVCACGNDNCEVTTAAGTFRVMCAASEVAALLGSTSSQAAAS